MGKRRILLSLVAGLAAALFAARAEAACQLQTLAEFPVTMEGSRPTVTLKIDGQDARFFIDSGAFFSSMTTASAARYGLKLGPAPFGMAYVRGVGRGEAEVQVATAKDVVLAGQLVHNVDFIVFDRGLGGDLAGVIGQNVLHNADIEYDLADGVVRLFKPNGCGYAPLAYWAKPDQTYADVPIEPSDMRSPHTRAWVSVNGERVLATFDTGSPRSMLSTAAAARAGVKQGMPGVVAVGVTSGVAARSYFQVWRGTFASFKIGGEEVRNTPLDFGDIGDDDMLVGADFFLSHRILVSNSQHHMYFTYNGGPVFSIDRPVQQSVAAAPASPAADNASEPTTADELARRAAADMSRRDYPAAIADWTSAVRLDPSNARYTLQRALAEMANQQPLLALAGIDQTLKLKPDDIPAYLARAELDAVLHRTDEAHAALDAADTLVDKAPDERLAIATGRARLGEDLAAIAELGLWLDGHPVDDRRAQALNERCWLRTLNATDLDQALVDCDAALKLLPGDPNILDSRGLTYFRLGELDRALSDYRASLNLRPNTPWSLYGLGLTEVKKGQMAQGQADMQTALAAMPRLAGEVKKYGLAP